MRRSILMISGGALLASPCVAQSGPVAQQSSEQLVCQLSGDCAGDAAPAATQDKGRSRGFSIAKPGQSNQQAKTGPAPKPVGQFVVPQGAQRQAPGRSARSGYVARKAAAAPMGAPGRADLLITFVSGSTEMTDQAKANAQQFAVALSSSQLSNMHFAIEGHTDAVGGRAYNLDLSQRRAQAVVDFLVASGASRARFDVHGYGFDRPLNSHSPNAAGNRRVEVVKVN